MHGFCSFRFFFSVEVFCFLSLYLYNDFEDFGCSKLYVLICCIEISINAFFLKKKKQKKICFFVECLSFFYLSISSFNSSLFSLIVRSRCDNCFFSFVILRIIRGIFDFGRRGLWLAQGFVIPLTTELRPGFIRKIVHGPTFLNLILQPFISLEYRNHKW
jgi:hypothetical protein